MVDQKLTVHWEIKKGDRVYIFEIPAGSPYGEIYDCGFEIMNSALEAQKQAAEQAQKQKEENKADAAAG